MKFIHCFNLFTFTFQSCQYSCELLGSFSSDQEERPGSLQSLSHPYYIKGESSFYGFVLKNKCQKVFIFFKLTTHQGFFFFKLLLYVWCVSFYKKSMDFANLHLSKCLVPTELFSLSIKADFCCPSFLINTFCQEELMLWYTLLGSPSTDTLLNIQSLLGLKFQMTWFQKVVASKSKQDFILEISMLFCFAAFMYQNPIIYITIYQYITEQGICNTVT